MPDKLLVTSFDDYIPQKYALAKLKPANKKSARKYKRIVRIYNNAAPEDKTICFFSRPTFDNARSYAMVTEYCRCGSNLCGDGVLHLFHFENNDWVRIGYLDVWSS